ncbi:MAG: 4-hydroxy-tetrahydrodipicolinate reductase [Bacteroidetes bacterium QS_8_64_10]|nr:MAG: 4-hydroxy-tetrahydrodipicolinate reductase [Bacteroidetes bacterium QS_8_64_10]
MKIALVGTGQMGQAVERLAPERDHEIAARFNTDRPLTDADPGALDDVDLVIDFSLPDVALEHIELYCEWNQPAVIGTTGWYDHLGDVQGWVDEHEASLLYAPNFSVGVALLRRGLRAVLPLLDELPEYDAYVREMHHRRKADSPSGTALMLADEVLAGLARKSDVDIEAQHTPVAENVLHVSSTRTGDVFGEHDVGFDSAFDHLKLSHRAKSRAGFAFGAIKAAEWLRGRQGLFTLEDVLEDWLGE